MSQWIGQTLNGRFLVEKPLGRGGMAAVYLASDQRLSGRKVVVKHPLREADRLGTGLSDEELRRRFQHEVARLTELDDIPSVVAILDQGVHEETPFYVMRHMAGGSLADLLARGPQAPGEALAWLKPVAEALDRLHERGVLHRDVKPDNLLFDQPPTGPRASQARAHLSDFGIVKELAAEWATTGKQNTGIGTPGYMAPEQLLENFEPDGRADQYALAATLYHALTGGKPRYGPTTGTTRGRKVLTPVHELAPHVPERVSAQIARALGIDPEGRFPTCVAFARAVEEALDVAAPRATTGSSRAPTQKLGAPIAGEAGAGGGGVTPPPSRPAARRGAYVALLALAGVGGFFGLRALGVVGRGAGERQASMEAAGGGSVPAAPAGSPAATPATPEAPAKPPESPPKDAEEPATPPQAAWESPLAEAEAAMARDDGDAAKAPLARAEAADVPAERVKVLQAYVKEWDRQPVLTITSPAKGAEIEAGADGTWRFEVHGHLESGRKQDRIVVGAAEVAVGPGAFSTWVTARIGGSTTVRAEVRAGEVVRAAVELQVTLLLPMMAGGASAEEENCHTLCMTVDLLMSGDGPELGVPFVVTARVTNAGDLALSNLLLALRGGKGVRHVGEDSLTAKVDRLPPGESRDLRVTFVIDEAGEFQVSTSARDDRGWAAAGKSVTLTIPALGAGRVGESETYAMEVRCEISSPIVLAGDSFTATTTVRNTGDVALTRVTLALRGGEGLTQVGNTSLVLEIPQLAPGATAEVSAQFVAEQIGERRIDASARENRGWTAAGCFCGVVVKGLPALQTELVDLDRVHGRKGVFELGDEFLYELSVENDGGTALTPDLKVLWRLPKELEFVSGEGDRGLTVTGKDDVAESSVFVLAPGQQLKSRVFVRVIGVPAGNLVATRASVVLAAGGTELATQSESTSLTGRQRPARLPALRMGMPDVNMRGEDRGIFEVGEQFLYDVVVGNEGGTGLSPDVRVVWTLPPELEFVSGTAERGATITGEDRTASSSAFALAPNQTMRLRLVVRCLRVPERSLVQTQASLRSASPDMELASVSESTTLKAKP